MVEHRFKSLARDDPRKRLPRSFVVELRRVRADDLPNNLARLSLPTCQSWPRGYLMDSVDPQRRRPDWMKNQPRKGSYPIKNFELAALSLRNTI